MTLNMEDAIRQNCTNNAVPLMNNSSDSWPTFAIQIWKGNVYLCLTNQIWPSDEINPNCVTPHEKIDKLITQYIETAEQSDFFPHSR